MFEIIKKYNIIIQNNINNDKKIINRNTKTQSMLIQN
jgi:hypothetical protein